MNKNIEYFQHNITNDSIPSIDGNYILLNRGIKFILNLLLLYLFITLMVYSFPLMGINVFILLICTISSVIFYILDLYFPACYI